MRGACARCSMKLGSIFSVVNERASSHATNMRLDAKIRTRCQPAIALALALTACASDDLMLGKVDGCKNVSCEPTELVTVEMERVWPEIIRHSVPLMGQA